MTLETESNLHYNLLKSFALWRKIAQIIHDDSILKGVKLLKWWKPQTTTRTRQKAQQAFDENNFYCKYGKTNQNCSF